MRKRWPGAGAGVCARRFFACSDGISGANGVVIAAKDNDARLEVTTEGAEGSVTGREACEVDGLLRSERGASPVVLRPKVT